MKSIVGDRFGIAMITASLVVIILISGQFLLHRKENRNDSIKIEGRNVVRLLSNLSYQQLIPERQHNGVLELLNTRENNSDFAYAAIINLDGEPLAVTSSGKSIVPNVDFGNEKKLWVTEHDVQAKNDARSILEFRAPLLKKGELTGYIRLGYFKPDLELTEISFLAKLAHYPYGIFKLLFRM